MQTQSASMAAAAERTIPRTGAQIIVDALLAHGVDTVFGYMGMVRQWQELFYRKRYVYSHLHNPDYAAFARAVGAAGVTVDSRDQVGPAIEQMLREDRPCVVDFHVDAEEECVSDGARRQGVARNGGPASAPERDVKTSDRSYSTYGSHGSCPLRPSPAPELQFPRRMAEGN